MQIYGLPSKGKGCCVHFRAALGPEKPRAPALPRACAVGKGHELHAGAESKAKPPLHKAHPCTDDSAVCQVSAPLPEEVKLQEGWEKPWGTVEGGTQGCRGAAA